MCSIRFLSLKSCKIKLKVSKLTKKNFEEKRVNFFFLFSTRIIFRLMESAEKGKKNYEILERKAAEMALSIKCTINHVEQ